MGHTSSIDWQDTYTSDLACYLRVTEQRAYALSHLADMTERNPNQGRQLRLLVGNQAWMEAKAHLFSGDNLYLGELRSAITRVGEEEGTTNFAALAALHTAQQVVWQRTSAWNDHCLVALAQLGRLAEARNALRLRPDPLDRVKGSVVLYQSATHGSVLEQELFAEITAALADVLPQHEQAEALRLIADAVCAQDARAGRLWFDRAAAAATAMQDELRQPIALEALCVALGRHHLFEQAMVVWRHIEPALDGTGVIRSRALRALALAATEAGDHATAAAFVAEIPDVQGKVRAACAIAIQPSSLPLDKRVAWYVQARRLNRTLAKGRQTEVGAAASVLRALSGSGDKALQSLARLADPGARVETGIAMAPFIQQDQKRFEQLVNELSAALEAVTEPGVRIRLLSQFLALLLRRDHAAAATVLAQLTTCIAANSGQEWPAGEASAAVNLLATAGYFAPAIAASEKIANRRQRAMAFGILAAQASVRHDPRSTAMLEAAHQAASAIVNDEVRIRQLLAVAVWLAQRDDARSEAVFEQARALIDGSPRLPGAAQDAEIRYAVARAQAGCTSADLPLRRIGQELLAPGNQFSPETKLLYMQGLAQAGKIEQAEAFAQTLPSDWERVSALIRIAVVLQQNQDVRLAQVLDRAKTDAETITDIDQGPTTLSALVRLLASVHDAHSAQLLDQLGAIVDSAQDEWDWQQAETARLEALVWCGWRMQALAGLEELGINELWGSVMLCSVEKWCEVGQIDQARAEAAEIQDDQCREEAWRLIAGSLAQAGQWQAALALYSPRNLAVFMDNISEWTIQARTLDIVTAASFWCECVRVAGWHDPFWRKLYDLLQNDGLQG